MKKLITLLTLFSSVIVVAQTVTNGSVTGTASNSGVNSGNAPGWSGCSYSPDVCDVGFPSYAGNSQVTPVASPDGGTWLGLASMSPAGATECAQTTITGLTIGQTYSLDFYAACFGTATSICNNSPATPTVSVGATSQMYTIPMAASTWVPCSMIFTATATTMILEAKHSSTFGGYYAYVGLDGFIISVPLPIELKDFNLSCEPEVVNVSWTTATEANNDFFTVERSRDGIHFESLAVVDGSGTSSTDKEYTWVDEKPLPGTSYYRLSQTDFNGNKETFEIQSISCFDHEQVLIYPNPFDNQITLSTRHSGDIELLDGTGKIVMKASFEAGRTTLSTNELSAGTYSARVLLSNGVIQTIKLVKI